MPTVELLCQMIDGVIPSKFSKDEKQFIEAELFIRLCEELKEVYKKYYKEYYSLIKLSTEMENTMLESNFIQCVINDILLTEEYTLQGIAFHTQIPEEIIYDIVIGSNKEPSLPLARKIIEIHRSIRPDLYLNLMKKIFITSLSKNE